MKVLEEGSLAFVYRPRVDTPLVHGLTDVQSLYLLLRPEGALWTRRIRIGRKRMPPPTPSHPKHWGVVDRVDALDALTDEFAESVYDTRTQGERYQPAARAAASGTYALVTHEGHTHLSYTLTLPQKLGPVQFALGLRMRGSCIIAALNPLAPRRGARSAVRPITLPRSLQARFGKRRSHPIDPASFLDQVGLDLLFIGAHGAERSAAVDVLPTSHEVLASLHLPDSILMRRPLEKGLWS